VSSASPIEVMRSLYAVYNEGPELESADGVILRLTLIYGSFARSWFDGHHCGWGVWAIEWALFIPGAAGALVTVYLAAKEVVPEFPPLVDVATKQEELARRLKRIRKTESEIDETQQELLSNPPISQTRFERISKHLDTSRQEVDADRARVQQLEKDVASRDAQGLPGGDHDLEPGGLTD
jgi:hypothetical protein